jgi:hypothetical protein
MSQLGKKSILTIMIILNFEKFNKLIKNSTGKLWKVIKLKHELQMKCNSGMLQSSY